MKKIVLTFLTILCCTALANAERFTVGVIIYYITGTNPNTVEVVGYVSTSLETATTVTYENIEIPSTVTYGNTEYKVMSIGSGAFDTYAGDTITSITISEGVTSFEEYAFSNCSGLTSITIPNSVTNIGNYAFSDCSRLTSITIPSSVTNMGKDAFKDCKIHLFNFINFFNESSFDPTANNYWGATIIYPAANEIWYTSSNNEPITPKSVGSITKNEYDGTDKNEYDTDKGLFCITFDQDVTSIGDYAFAEGITGYHNRLTSIYLPSSVTSIEYGAFFDCFDLKSVYIPSSVTSIGFGVFAGCTSLESITIPSSVTSIEKSAFASCPKLTAIYFQGATPPSIGENQFGIASDGVFIVPNEEAVTNYKTELQGKSVLLQENDVYTYSGYVNVLIDSVNNAMTDRVKALLTDTEISYIETCINNLEKVITNVTSADRIVYAKAETAKAMNIIANAEYRELVRVKKIEANEEIDKAVGSSEDATLLSIAATAKSSILSQSTVETIKATSDLAVAKINAIKEILPLIGDDTNAKNTKYISDIIATIVSAKSVNNVTTKKTQAVNEIPLFLKGFSSGFEKGKTAAFGTMGEKQNGPAVIVTDQDDKQIILYSPKKVQYIKVTNK